MDAHKRILFTYSWDLHGQRNKVLSAKMVLILIPYYFRFIRMAVQILSIKCILCLVYHSNEQCKEYYMNRSCSIHVR